MSKSVTFKLAGAAALAASTQAYGQIVYVTPPSNLTGVPVGAPKNEEFYDFFTGVTSDSPTGADLPPGTDFTPDFRFEVGNSNFYGYSIVYTGIKGLNSGGATINKTAGYYSGYAFADKLKGGTVVGNDNTNLTFITYPGGSVNLPGFFTAPGSDQTQSATEFIGVQFADSTGAFHNGYIQLEAVNNTPDNPGGLFFVAAAYNATPAGPDGVGDITIPEPGTISSLILGAAALGGVGLLRRRRSLLAQD